MNVNNCENKTDYRILKNFYVFEGIDGAGTSTQLKLLKERDTSGKIVITAEPTDRETGKFLRKMLAGNFELAPQTAAYAFAADRCEHIYGKGGVEELTGQGKIVVSDRYLFSSLAYQSVSCGTKLPEMLNSYFPLPEILFYFYINPEVSLARVNSRGEAKEIYEKIDYQKKTAELYESVIQKYEKLFEHSPESQKSENQEIKPEMNQDLNQKMNKKMNKKMRIVRIDAEKSIEEIAGIISRSIYGEKQC